MAKLKYLDLRQAVIDTCLRMNEEGINQGTSGNVSVRTPEGFLMTASGIPYDRMKPEHVVEMDLDGGYVGEYLPSTEWRMHMDIFKHRPEAGAVVHTHSIYATALSCLRKDIPPFHYMIGIAGGTTLRCATYAEYGTQELSDAMLKAMKDRQACLLANHGQIAFGPNLEKALWRAGEVETLCHQYWAALQAGKPVLLNERQMKTVLARFKTYGKQPDELKTGDALSVIGPVRRDAPKRAAPRVLAARKKAGKPA
ncbi:class II aldolase/adducin family protein [Aestuariivirga sp.]|uniref:class II aldolase/adducin family protein n=1 Tax=Aestuariivirga sp. TaxID=2650926 RepID=UPI00391A389E